VFGTLEGAVRDPGYLTLAWRRAVVARALPKVTLHALRHSHASALIARKTDVVTVSKQLGHGSPTTTLSTYAHLFDKSDEQTAKVMDALLNTGDG
jgi:integrase